MNKIDEIALRVDAKTTWVGAPSREDVIKFAHALLAELSKDAEPAGYQRRLRYQTNALVDALETIKKLDKARDFLYLDEAQTLHAALVAFKGAK